MLFLLCGVGGCWMDISLLDRSYRVEDKMGPHFKLVMVMIYFSEAFGW